MLANKNEDIIEFNHQTWKREKEQMRMVKNFQTQQCCQVKHYKVRFIIQRFQRERKREKTPAQQQQRTIQKQTAKAKAKHAKWELFSQPQSVRNVTD
jgi:hypothetical protein